MLMKTSDGETAHSRNNKDTKLSNRGSYIYTPQDTSIQDRTSKSKSRSSKPKWIQESSYVMGEDSPLLTKPKKELTHSEAFQFDQPKSLKDSDRKYSINTVKARNKHSPSINAFYNVMKESQNQHYLDEFSSLLNEDKCTPRKVTSNRVIEEDKSERLLEEHLDAVIKSNGWTNSFMTMLNSEKQLKESFHQGD